MALKSLLTNDLRWQAIVDRDRAFDGEFYYSVKTTGVYCKPSCAARLPKPENVDFHLSFQDAERAGFRSCKRCQPNQASLKEQHAAKIAEICREIEASEEILSLEHWAKYASLSTYHFHRIFKEIIGVTPRAYAVAHRRQRVQNTLVQEDASVTEAIYESGFNSSGRFYESTDQMLGMTPTDLRKGGSNVEIYFAVGECSLGSILVAQSKKGICAILMGDDPELLVRDLQDRFPKAQLLGGDKQFEDTVAKVVGFIETPSREFVLPLDVQGTAFQQGVWQALKEIPVGSKTTYAEIAAKIGQPTAFRAVALACGANPVAVAIPCHRVVKSNGDLSGYRWGIERKRALLEKEKL